MPANMLLHTLDCMQACMQPSHTHSYIEKKKTEYIRATAENKHSFMNWMYKKLRNRRRLGLNVYVCVCAVPSSEKSSWAFLQKIVNFVLLHTLFHSKASCVIMYWSWMKSLCRWSPVDLGFPLIRVDSYESQKNHNIDIMSPWFFYFMEWEFWFLETKRVMLLISPAWLLWWCLW